MTNFANNDARNDAKEITVDIMFGSIGKGGEALTGVVQKALLESFQQAGNLDDLATRLAIPIQYLSITGAKVITAHGYDAYKIIIAIRSDEPNSVAKEVFSLATGLATTAITTPYWSAALGALLPTGGEVVGIGLGIGSGAYASNAAGKFWDYTIGKVPLGQWATNAWTDTFGVAIKVTPGLPPANTPTLSDVPPANLAPSSLLVLDPTDLNVKLVFNQDPTPSFDPDAPAGTNTYVVQKGDTLWKIAQSNGWDFGELKQVNPQLTDPNFIQIGQRIHTPGLVMVDNTGLSVSTTTDLLPGFQDAVNDANAGAGILQGVVIDNGVAKVTVNGVTLNSNGVENTTLSDIVSDGIRPGNFNSTQDRALWNALDANFMSLSAFDSFNETQASSLNNLSFEALNTIYVDPLVLDLNGNQVQLTSYGSNPVLFDIDNDGGSLELSGWVSAKDGILVRDLNGNGKIDHIGEMFSDYYGGESGANGQTGSQPYQNGFAALRSLDSNDDQRFTDSDNAWNQVRVWIDADHDAKTDAGELQTLDALGITRINLNAKTQSGLMRDGNSVLASGSFMQNGEAREALALNFLADPNGHRFSGDNIIATQGGVSSYVATDAQGETIDVQAKNVQNAYGAAGDDVLIGDGQDNWLVGGRGSDRFNAGAGDDVLLIDTKDLPQNIHLILPEQAEAAGAINLSGITFFRFLVPSCSPRITSSRHTNLKQSVIKFTKLKNTSVAYSI